MYRMEHCCEVEPDWWLDQQKSEKSKQSREGVFTFYQSRIQSAPNYGFKSGHEILNIILRCAFWDSFLTDDEYQTIINLCQKAHIKMMEQNWKETWKDEGQQ